MSSIRLVAGTLAVAILLIAWGIWVETAIPAPGADVVTFDYTIVESFESDETNRRDGEARLLDRYGNQVERAVSDYRIDYRGDLYERHSPQTAVPKLTPPIG